MFLRKSIMILLVGLLSVILASCSKSSDGQTPREEPPSSPPVTENQAPQVSDLEKLVNEPVELVFTYPYAAEEPTTERFLDQARKKFPNWTIQFVELATNEANSMENALATNQTMDLLVSSLGSSYQVVFPYQLEADMSDLIKKYNFDLNKFNPSVIEVITQIGNGEVQSLPWTAGTLVFIYNKDIFEKFGVDYPRDGMTWDEVYSLANVMTRKEGDVQYKGLVLDFDFVVGLNQVEAPMFDAVTHKPMFTSDKFTSYFQSIARFFDIPGNEPDPAESVYSYFHINKTAAMMIGSPGYVSVTASSEIENWDIATYPAVPGLPGVGPAVTPDLIYLPKASKNRDAAFQVLSYLVSEEQQAWRASALGIAPALKDVSDIMENFGQNLKGIDKVNTQAIVPKSSAKWQPSPYYSRGLGYLWSAPFEYVKSKDVNTILREINENAEKMVEEDLASK